jgi:hypothetical protein
MADTLSSEDWQQFSRHSRRRFVAGAVTLAVGPRLSWRKAKRAGPLLCALFNSAKSRNISS